MTNTELERARELKHKLDVAWKQVGEFAANLTNMGFDVHLCCASEWFFDRLVISGDPEKRKQEVEVTKTEVIEL